MTREKKEIQKKIDYAEEVMYKAMGYGFIPDSAYEYEEAIINYLEEKLARLQHYESMGEKEADRRWLNGCPELKAMMGLA